ncbi:hypothetical protein OROGR_000314 [Orobanche gracilis]
MIFPSRVLRERKVIEFSGLVPACGNVEVLCFRYFLRRDFGTGIGFVITGKRKAKLARKDQANEDIIKGHRAEKLASGGNTNRVGLRQLRPTETHHGGGRFPQPRYSGGNTPRRRIPTATHIGSKNRRQISTVEMNSSCLIVAHGGEWNRNIYEGGYVLRPCDMQSKLLSDHGVTVNYRTSLAGKHHAINQSYGDAGKSFQYESIH